MVKKAEVTSVTLTSFGFFVPNEMLIETLETVLGTARSGILWHSATFNASSATKRRPRYKSSHTGRRPRIEVFRDIHIEGRVSTSRQGYLTVQAHCEIYSHFPDQDHWEPGSITITYKFDDSVLVREAAFSFKNSFGISTDMYTSTKTRLA